MLKPKIGFIGLGDMGFPMAARLLTSGFSVTSCAHRRREPLERLKTYGLSEVANTALAASSADVLITMVYDDQQTDAVLRGPSGALAHMKRGSAILLMSTLSPNYCTEIAKAAEPLGIEVLDCPVTGARMAAEKGTLALIVGGESELIEKVRPVLNALGTIYHCGSLGMGSIAKLAHNAIAFTTIGIVDEAREMARSYGVDLTTFMGIVAQGTGKCFVADKWDFITDGWAQFSATGRKDVELCIKAARDKNVVMRLAEDRLAVDWKLRSN